MIKYTLALVMLMMGCAQTNTNMTQQRRDWKCQRQMELAMRHAEPYLFVGMMPKAIGEEWYTAKQECWTIDLGPLQ